FGAEAVAAVDRPVLHGEQRGRQGPGHLGGGRRGFDLVRHGRLSPEYTMRPPTIVSVARPLSARPENGGLPERERRPAGLSVQAASGSMTVTSARRPSASVPPRSPNAAAGPVDMRRTKSEGDRPTVRTSSSTSGTAVSSPMTPNAACSNSTS